MKKLFLLSAVGALAASEASAQLINHGNSVREGRSVISAVPAKTLPASGTTAKTTAPDPRRYDHSEYISGNSLETFQGTSLIMWQDSTMKQFFTTDGLVTVNFSSVAQVFFPFDEMWNDFNNPALLGLTAVTKTNSYVVDSVRIAALYVENPNRPAGIVDTLEISVATQPASNTTYWRRATSAWTAPYLPSGKDTFYTAVPANVDSVRRTALSNPTSAARVSWKVPLTAADRVPSSATTFSEFSYKLPSTMTVPAGNVVIVSYTFRSADTWIPNVDTVTSRHGFRPGFIFPVSPTTPTESMAPKYTWYEGDHSMSSIMFSTNPDQYTPGVAIGATNNPSAWFFQYLMNSITISCATCGVVESGGSIKESSILSDINAFPNPANGELNIPFTIAEKSNVSVSISNMIGQVIATQNMGNINAGQKATATFNTASLPSGVYLYTVEANGQRVTNRFNVAH